EPLRLAMYRVLEEAINNVYRHASAGRVEVELGLAGSSLSLLDRDDGCGFDPSAARRGLGLGIVGDRVDQAGGSWSVASALGRGTTVQALFQLGGGGEPPAARGLPAPGEAPADRARARDALAAIAHAASGSAELTRRLLEPGQDAEPAEPERIELAELLRDVARFTSPRWRSGAAGEGRAIRVAV